MSDRDRSKLERAIASAGLNVVLSRHEPLTSRRQHKALEGIASTEIGRQEIASRIKMYREAADLLSEYVSTPMHNPEGERDE